jgi:hypothetical protein
MDETEAAAKSYLAGLGLGEPVYEPDGNVPPDFLLGGRIAVEVRRLNQNDPHVGAPRGLEEDQIPMLARMRGLLRALGPPKAGRSWFVSYRLVRPLQPWATLSTEIRRALEEFGASRTTPTGSVELGTSLEITVHPASELHAEMFVLGGYTDRDSGGWLLAEMERNLTICIREKTDKIKAHRSKYPVWWLVLVDHIALGLSDYDRELFKDRVRVHHDWDRVVLLDRRDSTRVIDVERPGRAESS